MSDVGLRNCLHVAMAGPRWPREECEVIGWIATTRRVLNLLWVRKANAEEWAVSVSNATLYARERDVVYGIGRSLYWLCNGRRSIYVYHLIKYNIIKSVGDERCWIEEHFYAELGTREILLGHRWSLGLQSILKVAEHSGRTTIVGREWCVGNVK